jgi:hypothetical protein
MMRISVAGLRCCSSKELQQYARKTEVAEYAEAVVVSVTVPAAGMFAG